MFFFLLCSPDPNRFSLPSMHNPPLQGNLNIDFPPLLAKKKMTGNNVKTDSHYKQNFIFNTY